MTTNIKPEEITAILKKELAAFLIFKGSRSGNNGRCPLDESQAAAHRLVPPHAEQKRRVNLTWLRRHGKHPHKVRASREEVATMQVASKWTV